MSQADRLRLAVVGVGDVAQRDYLPEAHRLRGAEIVAVCGRSTARARDVAARYAIPAWFTSYDELLAASEAFDAVVNLTPMQVHEDITLAALRAGKHVYTEKPAASTVEGALRLRDEAARAGATLVCAPSVMLFPQVVHVQELLDRRVLGTVSYARAQVLAGIPPWAGYLSDPTQFFHEGGGPAVDLAVYPLHVITGLLGSVTSVTAMSARSRSGFTVTEGPYAGCWVDLQVDDNWELVLELDTGALASVNANYAIHASLAPGLELHGDEGSVALDPLDVAAPVAWLDPATDSWSQTTPAHDRTAGPDHILGVAHLVNCVWEGTGPVPSIDHAIHVLEVLELAEESIRTGQRQRPRSTVGGPPAPT